MKAKVRKLGDLTKPIVAFAEDAQIAEDAVDASDTQYNRRAMVRALFAMIEGTVFFLKQTIFTAGTHKKGSLSLADALLLLDSSAEMSSKGESDLRTKFIRLEDNLRFTANMLKKVYGVTITLGIGSANWDKFQKAIAIRNRITHPKAIEDFVIDSEDLSMLRDVRGWFCQMIADSVNGIVQAVNRANKGLEGTGDPRTGPPPPQP